MKLIALIAATAALALPATAHADTINIGTATATLQRHAIDCEPTQIVQPKPDVVAFSCSSGQWYRVRVYSGYAHPSPMIFIEQYNFLTAKWELIKWNERPKPTDSGNLS